MVLEDFGLAGGNGGISVFPGSYYVELFDGEKNVVVTRGLWMGTSQARLVAKFPAAD